MSYVCTPYTIYIGNIHMHMCACAHTHTHTHTHTHVHENAYILCAHISDDVKLLISHITAPDIHDMNIYHNMTSYTLLTCKSRANHNEEAGKHAGYNNELYMTWH